jgi:WD40 repeat protein
MQIPCLVCLLDFHSVHGESLRRLLSKKLREGRSMKDQYRHSVQEYLHHLQSLRMDQTRVKQLKEKSIIDCHNGQVNVVLHLEHDLVATCHYDEKGKILIWDIKEEKLVREITVGDAQGIFEICHGATGQLVAAFLHPSILQVIDWRTGRVINSIKAEYFAQYGHRMLKAFGIDNRYVLTAERELTKLYDTTVNGGLLVRSYKGPRTTTCIEILPNHMVASGYDTHDIKLWDIETENTCATLKGHTQIVSALQLVNERTLISGGHDHTIILWDIVTYQKIRVVGNHNSWLAQAIVLSNEIVAFSALNGSVTMWDINRCSLVREIRPHSDFARCVTLIGDDCLITSSRDNTMHVWRVEDSKCIV